MKAPPGADHWTDGVAGGLVWVFAGLVPAALAAVALAVRRAGQTGVRGVLVATTCVSLSTVLGAGLRVREPHVDGALAALGAGLDTVAVALAAITAGTLLRPRRALRLSVVAAIVSLVVGLAFVIAGHTTQIPDQLPAWSLLQVPSLSFLGDAGETVLLLLGLGPVVAVGLAAWLFAEATVDERRRLRWLALCLLIGLGVVTVMQLVRKLGLLDVADGFLAAFPRAIWWAAALVGSAATIADPRLGDAAAASRRVAVGVGTGVVRRRRRRTGVGRRRRHHGAHRAGSPRLSRQFWRWRRSSSRCATGSSVLPTAGCRPTSAATPE